MKVLYVYLGRRWWWGYEERLVESINTMEADIHIDFLNVIKEYELPFFPTLELSHKNRVKLLPFYKELKKRAQIVDIVLICGRAVPPELMADLPALVVFRTTDDPDSSETRSFPFLKAADVVAHAGVNYDSKRRLSEVFLQRGAKRCVFWPIGFLEERFPEIEDFDTQFKRRDIDLVYVGHLKQGKLEKIMNRYKGMTVYSRSLKLKHKVYAFVKTGRWIRPFTGDLGKLYMRAKIGINMHFTYGPCNARCHDLNAAGVAQVIDCPEGISEIYEPSKEVLVYANIEEAIEKIDLLLSDDSIRYRISKAGYERARAEYSAKDTFVKMLRSL